MSMYPKIKIDTKRKSDNNTSKITVDRKARYRIERRNLNVKAEKANIEIEWYSQSSKKSKRLEGEFTNFVENFLTDIQVENAVEVLNENLMNIKKNIIDTVEINYGEQGDRLKNIIELYFDMDNTHEDYWFAKTDINTEFQTLTNRRGSFRVIMVNMKEMNSNKHYLQIIFLDPHHLFIPSRYNGKTSEQNKIDTYRECQEYDTCLSKHII